VDADCPLLLERRERYAVFGVSAAQLKLFLGQMGATGADTSDEDAPDFGDANAKLRGASGIDDSAAKPAKQPPLRKPPGAQLPRVDNVIKVPEAERRCPACGAERTCIGHDVMEVVELEPARVIVRVDRREKLGCEPCDGQLVRAPVGDKVVSGGRLGSTLVAVLVVDKYDDGLPLHRQKRRFERMGVDLAVSTLADQVTWATDLMRPLWRLAISQVLTATVMHLDATGLPVLDRDAAGGKRLGALWGYVGDENVAAYLYTSTGKKSGQRPNELGPEDMLAQRLGYTVADASNLFDSSFERPDLIECGCNGGCTSARTRWCRLDSWRWARRASSRTSYSCRTVRCGRPVIRSIGRSTASPAASEPRSPSSPSFAKGASPARVRRADLAAEMKQRGV